MISCYFNGRLGNNMFQIANVVSVATKLNDGMAFHSQSFAGHRAMVDVNFSIFDYKYSIGYLNENIKYIEPNEYVPVPITPNTTYCGFYQDYRYFNDIKTKLATEYFAPSQEVVEKLKRYKVLDNSLGICVRRGDYLMLQGNHCVLGLEYYQSAIDQYFQDVDQIYVFSDDYEWCKENFGNQVDYAEDTIGVQLFLMAKMKNLILANSTFSWWGAYLNMQGGKIIIPDPWYGPNCSARTDGLKYSGWIQHTHKIVISPFRIDQKMYN